MGFCFRYHSLAPMYYRGAQAAIVVYDITNQVNINLYLCSFVYRTYLSNVDIDQVLRPRFWETLNSSVLIVVFLRTHLVVQKRGSKSFSAKRPQL